MTLLDSFITDLTRFLLLLKPSAVPKERQIRVGEALEAKDYASIVDLVVSKYLNELAYRTLRDRLLILQDKFGLPLPDQSLLSAVESASELRNQLIHNASRFRYAPSDERGSVRTTTRSLPAVDWPTAEKHHNAVVELVRYLFESVSRQIFKQEPEGELLRVLGGAPSL